MKKLLYIFTLGTVVIAGIAYAAVDKTITSSGDLILDSGNQIIVKKETVFQGGTVGISGSGLSTSEVAVPAGTTLSQTFMSNNYYIVDMAAATGDVTGGALQAGEADAMVKIALINNPNGYTLNVDASGTEKILYGDVQYDDVDLGNTTSWVDLTWDSVNGYWLATDNATFFTGNFNGDLGITGRIDFPSTQDFSDIWSGDVTTNTGWIGTNGSYRLSVYANGYRNTSGGFTYMDIDGHTNTASGIDLDPDGTVYFRGGTASGAALPTTGAVSSTGVISSPSGFAELNDNTTGMKFLGDEDVTLDSGGDSVYTANRYGFMNEVPTVNLSSVAGRYKEFTASLSATASANGVTPAIIDIATATSAAASSCASVQAVVESFVRRGDSVTYQVQHFFFFNSTSSDVTITDSDLGGGVTGATCYWNGTGTTRNLRCRIDESYAAATYVVKCMNAECGSCEPSERWAYRP